MFKIADPTGPDLIKVFASSQPLNLKGIIETKGEGIRGSSTAIDEFLQATFRNDEKTRSAVFSTEISTEELGIYSFIFNIIK